MTAPSPPSGFQGLPVSEEQPGRPPTRTSQRGSLGQAVRRGLGFSVLNNVLSRIGTLLAGIITARLLLPADYGVFAVALVVLNALLSFNELGVSLAIVRWPEEPSRIASTVVTLSILSSAALYGVIFISAPMVADSLGSPNSVGTIRVLSLGVLIDGVTSVPAALLTRAFQQGRRMIADLVGLVVTSGVTIVLAADGHGAWSLAFGYIAGTALNSLAIWAFAPNRPRPGFDRSAARELLAFGLPLAAASFLAFGVLNLDYVIVGSMLGPVALGLYLLAFNLSSWPVNMFSTAVRRVAMAGFARLNDDRAALQEGFARSLALLLAVTFPVCALLSVLAPQLIRVVYGPRWAQAADALRWLAVLAAARVAYELAYDLLVARARSGAVFAVQAVWLVVLAPALLLGAHVDGIKGVSLAHGLIAWAVVAPLFLFALRGAGISVRGTLRHSTRPAVATGLLLAVVLALSPFITGDLERLMLLGGAGGTTAALLLLPMIRLARAARTPLSADG